jgi:hypothetical protein
MSASAWRRGHGPRQHRNLYPWEIYLAGWPLFCQFEIHNSTLSLHGRRLQDLSPYTVQGRKEHKGKGVASYCARLLGVGDSLAREHGSG